MQNLDVISVNIWQMAASLANLVILFLIVKKFLYKPVKKMLEERRRGIDEQYSAAAEAKAIAEKDRQEYGERLRGADAEADAIIKKAVEGASRREKEMLDDAKTKADIIVKRAEADAALERKKAEDGIKREIVDVSAALFEKILEREISEKDHEKLIESFIDGMGEDNEAD